MDLDCEILDNIEELFSCLDAHELAICPDSLYNTLYNSGVIVFRRDSKLIQRCADLCLKESCQYWCDDRVLSHLLQQDPHMWYELPLIYNWKLSQGIPIYAKIIHWCGEWGKCYIAKHGGMKKLLRGDAVR